MKARFLEWTIAFTELLLICMVAFSQTISSPQRNISEIWAVALQTDWDYQRACVAEGKKPIGSDYGEYEIPPKYWTDAVKELKPVKVYDHSLNVVIVLSIRDGEEEGIYLM